VLGDCATKAASDVEPDGRGAIAANRRCYYRSEICERDREGTCGDIQEREDTWSHVWTRHRRVLASVVFNSGVTRRRPTFTPPGYVVPSVERDGGRLRVGIQYDAVTNQVESLTTELLRSQLFHNREQTSPSISRQPPQGQPESIAVNR